jgi:hypothetical protein
MNETQVLDMLASRFSPPAYGFFRHIKSSTGYSANDRTADALAIGLWPSRGIELHGFEVKVSRSDWLKELQNPAKADEIGRFCHRWWIVTGDRKNIILPGELPPTWGWLAPQGGSLREMVGAPRMDPRPMTLNFIASLFRRMDRHFSEGYVSKDQIQPKLKEAFEQGKHKAVMDRDWEIRSLREMKAKVEEFEAASGVKLSEGEYRWQMGNVGEAVREIVRSRVSETPVELVRMSRMLKAITARIDGYLEATRPGIEGRVT